MVFEPQNLSIVDIRVRMIRTINISIDTRYKLLPLIKYFFLIKKIQVKLILSLL